MTDRELTAIWAALEPAARQRRRVDARVFEWVEAHDTSLASEWLGLIRVHPIAVPALSMAGALSLALVTPLSWAAYFIRIMPSG